MEIVKITGIIVGFYGTIFFLFWFFSRNVVVNFLFPKPKAALTDLGKKVAVLWNPQGSTDFGEDEVWREGVISHVWDDGGFVIDMGSATMVCIANKHGRDVNPFKHVKFI